MAPPPTSFTQTGADDNSGFPRQAHQAALPLPDAAGEHCQWLLSSERGLAWAKTSAYLSQTYGLHLWLTEPMRPSLTALRPGSPAARPLPTSPPPRGPWWASATFCCPQVAYSRDLGQGGRGGQDGFPSRGVVLLSPNPSPQQVASLIPTICIPFRRSVTPLDVRLSHTPTCLQPRAQLLWLFFLVNLQVIKRRKHKTAKQGNQILILPSAVLLTAQVR